MKTTTGPVMVCMNSMLDGSLHTLAKVIQTVIQLFPMTPTVTMTSVMEAVQMKTLVTILRTMHAVVKTMHWLIFPPGFSRSHLLKATYCTKRFYLPCQFTINTFCLFQDVTKMFQHKQMKRGKQSK